MTFINVDWFKAKRTLGFESGSEHANYLESPGGVTWAGVRNQYFTSILTPATPAKGVWAGRYPVKTATKDTNGIEGAVEMPGFKLAPGETARQTLTLYTGPKEYRRLSRLGQGQSTIMDFGWFKIVSVFLLRVMNRLHDGFQHIGLKSYAWSIILLTFIVRGALWPIQGAATKSMKKMASVQPKLEAIKAKHKDDPQKLNQEMLKLYKENGINPAAGCLPMLIQIPIFFGFYSMLGTAVELRNSPFLWVSDLSMPDTILHLGSLPVNILPLLMAGTMVWQMALSPKSGDPAMQKSMMLMPVIFIFITYNFASALALYYTVQNILSIFQLYVTRNQNLSTPAPAVAGKGGRPGRR